MNENDWQQIGRAIKRDPAQRGLLSAPEIATTVTGELRAAAHDLADRAVAVALVTGFCVCTPDGRWVGETDGPPGAMFLARALAELGIDVRLISDQHTIALLEIGCDHWGLPRSWIETFPFESADPADPSRVFNGPHSQQKSDDWVEAFFSGPFGRRLTHIIAIERAGPSHTRASVSNQPGASNLSRSHFLEEVSPESRNLCHSMRAISINAHTAKTHRLFEAAGRRPELTTIGIGDGGNEIGMGNFAWQTLSRAIAAEHGGKIACRIGTNRAILAGVSDWAAYALAVAVCDLRGRRNLISPWSLQSQRELIEVMVRETDAVDGVTARREATVDGLPLDTYLGALAKLRGIMGFDP